MKCLNMKKNNLLGSILGKSGAYGFSGLLAQLVGFVMLPIYTHHMTPQDYGVASLVIFMVSLSEIVFGARLGQAIPKYLHDKNYSFTLPQLYTTAVITSTALSIIALFIVLFWSGGISALMFETRAYSVAVVIGGLMIVFNGLETYGLLFLRLQENPSLYLKLALLKLAFQLALNILLIVIFEYGVVGLLLSNLIASIILTIVLQYIAYQNMDSAIALDQSALKVMLKFCAPLWYTSLVGLYVGSVHMLFISKKINLEVLGLYALASRFSGLVMVLFWTPFFQYWQAERFKLLNTNKGAEAFSHIYYFVIAGLAITSLFIIAGADVIIVLLTEKSFHGSAEFIPLLVIANIFTCMAMFMNFSYMVKEKNYFIFNMTLFSAPIITAGLFVFTWWLGDIGPAVALAVTAVVTYAVNAFYSQKTFDLGISQLKVALLLLFYSVLTLSIYWILGNIELMYARLAFLVALGVVMVSVAWVLMKKGLILNFLLKEKSGD